MANLKRLELCYLKTNLKSGHLHNTNNMTSHLVVDSSEGLVHTEEKQA